MVSVARGVSYWQVSSAGAWRAVKLERGGAGSEGGSGQGGGQARRGCAGAPQAPGRLLHRRRAQQVRPRRAPAGCTVRCASCPPARLDSPSGLPAPFRGCLIGVFTPSYPSAQQTLRCSRVVAPGRCWAACQHALWTQETKRELSSVFCEGEGMRLPYLSNDGREWQSMIYERKAAKPSRRLA